MSYVGPLYAFIRLSRLYVIRHPLTHTMCPCNFIPHDPIVLKNISFDSPKRNLATPWGPKKSILYSVLGIFRCLRATGPNIPVLKTVEGPAGPFMHSANKRGVYVDANMFNSLGMVRSWHSRGYSK